MSASASCAECGRPLRLGQPLAVRNKCVVHHAAEDCVPAYPVGEDYQRHRVVGLPPERATGGAADVILTTEQQRAVGAIEDAIAAGRNFSLHGLAGTGKTTIAARIAASLSTTAYLRRPPRRLVCLRPKPAWRRQPSMPLFITLSAKRTVRTSRPSWCSARSIPRARSKARCCCWTNVRWSAGSLQPTSSPPDHGHRVWRSGTATTR